ncbi:MAG: DNA methyltransferase, partial [Ralstonia sp.]
AGFPESDGQAGAVSGYEPSQFVAGRTIYGKRTPTAHAPRGDSGSAARFFYSSKADSEDRIGSKHPTVKPIALMRWLCRMVTPPGGVILDPFAGTGTTGEAALLEGFNAILIEREEEYRADIARRMEAVFAGKSARMKAKAARGAAKDAGPLFGEAAA